MRTGERESSESATKQDSWLSAELLREADLDMAARLGYGIYGYPMIFLFLWMTTHYAVTHPTFFWTLATIVGIAMATRLALAILRERVFAVNRRLLVWPLAFSVVLGSGASGLLVASALWFYGYENWTFILLLLWMSGIMAGSGASFSSNLQMLAAHVVLLLGPVFGLSLYIGGVQGNTFAVFCAAFCIFMVFLGNHLHKLYWKQLENRALESARARELEIAKQAAETANLAKSQFLANTSHEIRTPMHGILGMAQLAIDAETPQECREHIRTLRSCAQGLLNVLNDILDFSKIEAGKLTLENIPFSLQQSVAEVRAIALPMALAKGLTLECKVAAGAPDMLVGDPTRLRQVLINLLGNATKFTESGSVSLLVTQAGAPFNNEIGLQFQVSDTGIGIAPEHQERIFEAFAQTDGSVARRFGGTGLGLAISSQLVHLMGGRLSVDSTPKVGSTFAFTCVFALAKQEIAVHATVSAVVAPPMRIMLAEDNPVNQVLASALLRKRGHHIKVVPSGTAAVQAWEAEDFDLILMDDQMPGMSGVEAARQIRAKESASGKRIYIIALTANALLADREELLAAGMDSYLAKPFSAEELYEAIRQVSVSS